MATNFAGQSGRLFPWQMKHYIQRGGPLDPTIQATGGPPVTGGGVLSWNSTVTLPPIPGTQTPPAVPLPRVQSLNSTGTLTVTTGVLATNVGGIFVGTVPGGAWIDELEIYCYSALAGGSSTSVGLFYANADAQGAAPGFQPATLWLLGYITGPVAGTVYSSRGVPATGNTVTNAGALRAQLTGWQTGPGNGVAGPQQLASLGPPGGQGFGGLAQGAAQATPGDIDLYFASFLIAGNGVAPTAGSFGFRLDFTGLEG